MESCAHVNAKRKQSQGDKHLVIFPVGTKIGVLALDFYNCIILRFHNSLLNFDLGQGIFHLDNLAVVCDKTVSFVLNVGYLR